MKPKPCSASRRSALTRIAIGSCAMGLALAARTQAASGKAKKSDFSYQDHPHDGRSCSACKFFSPSGKGDQGTCQVVEGDISRNGWCMAFVAKI
jgi:hypothetical protein